MIKSAVPAAALSLACLFSRVLAWLLAYFRLQRSSVCEPNLSVDLQQREWGDGDRERWREMERQTEREEEISSVQRLCGTTGRSIRVCVGTDRVIDFYTRQWRDIIACLNLL